MKLNGWQRIGIVLSILWLVPVASFPLIQLWTYPEDTLHNSPFFDWIVPAADVPSAENDDLYDLFEPDLVPKLKIGLYLLFAFGPVIGFWLLIYLCIYTIRWVFNGFKHHA